MVRMLLLVATLLALTASCSRGEASPAPPNIRYGEDNCTECNMLISDARFAAGYAYETSPGRFESKAFDDIGGMLVHAEKHPDDQVAAWYVHDYDSEEWLDATKAIFVVSSNVPTPMGYGILAYADESAAQDAAAAIGGTVLTWDTLRSSDVGHGR